MNKSMRSAGAVILSLILVTSALSRLAARPAAANPVLPRFVTTACPFTPGDGLRQGRDVQCGYVDVPARHERPRGPTIRLAIAIFKTRARQPGTPEIYLQGGPGGDLLAAWGPAVGRAAGCCNDVVPIGDRDLILLDQRGTGYSQPSLACPEVSRVSMQSLDATLSDATRRTNALRAIVACHDRLVHAGVDLSAYTTAESAADVNDVRVALGLRQVDLYGVSYGAELAQAVMRDYPHAVRSAVLDSVVPLQENLIVSYLPAYAAAFADFFHACSVDPRCASRYPHLSTLLQEVLERLDTDPVTMYVTNAYTGVLYQVRITHDSFAATLYSALYAQSYALQLPAVIAAAQRGSFALFGQLFGVFGFQSGVSSLGQYLSVTCSENQAISSPTQLTAAAQVIPPWLRHGILGGQLDLLDKCAVWHVRSVPPATKQPVHSTIPTLILTGPYDPITPPANGRMVARYLAHSYVVEVPRLGHGMRYLTAPCPLQIAAAFEDHPARRPDLRCLTSMPKLSTLPFQ